MKISQGHNGYPFVAAENPVVDGEPFDCPHCSRTLFLLRRTPCTKCGNPREQYGGPKCKDCRNTVPNIGSAPSEVELRKYQKARRGYIWLAFYGDGLSTKQIAAAAGIGRGRVACIIREQNRRALYSIQHAVRWEDPRFLRLIKAGAIEAGGGAQSAWLDENLDPPWNTEIPEVPPLRGGP